jgi:hypothetical protein
MKHLALSFSFADIAFVLVVAVSQARGGIVRTNALRKKHTQMSGEFQDAS